MGIQVKPLHDFIGAEVRGVDLSSELDDETARAINQAWLENLVLIFPEQDINDGEQEAFCRHFGELEMVRTTQAQNSDHPAVLMITNVKKPGMSTALEDGEMMFHYDQCYYEQPCKGSTLYAMEVPEEGGNTLFANCYAAYDGLSDEWKKRIDGLTALNYYDYERDPTVRPESISPDAPQYVHPVVRTHSETGRKSLYVNRLMTIRIEGVSDEESDEILNHLFEAIENPEHIYEHVWTVGDLLMWDNRCSVHARTFFSPDSRRMMRRVTIKDPAPVA